MPPHAADGFAKTTGYLLKIASGKNRETGFVEPMGND